VQCVLVKLRNYDCVENFLNCVLSVVTDLHPVASVDGTFGIVAYFIRVHLCFARLCAYSV